MIHGSVNVKSNCPNCGHVEGKVRVNEAIEEVPWFRKLTCWTDELMATASKLLQYIRISN